MRMRPTCLADVHPKIVSGRLGHATIAITMDIDTHAIPGLQVDAAQRIDAALLCAILGTQGGKPVVNIRLRPDTRWLSD
jgi:hypothetical protein